ncbi:MAG: DUF1730 domain-containing protein [Bacteroidales bacterium]|jgi:epoxyqueuosine reductase|nr:DUF1730 domain-containing protein [Bacteroidales bacterium]
MDNFIDFSIIESLSEKAGFQLCGAISKQEFDISFLFSWLNKNYNADLQYLGNNIDKRENPFLLLENSKTIFSFVASYNTESFHNLPFTKEENGLRFASYTHFFDYHSAVKSALNNIISSIQEIYPTFKAITFVDSAPFFEKLIAQKAFLGNIGRNGCLINKEYGSKILIGEIITNYSTNYFRENNMEDPCKECSLCKDSCPNCAINDDRTINCNLCSSYLNQSNKENIPENINLRNFIFGCDICLNACPYNNKERRISNSKIMKINPNMQRLITKINQNNLDKETFYTLRKDSPLKELKYEKLISNINFALKKS